MQESISVIIPVYNAGRFIGQAIRSVWAQTRAVREVIVVDDGSTDHTKAELEALVPDAPCPLRIVTQANQGPAAARNLGVSLATGSLLAFLDADDLWLPTKLEEQCARFESLPDSDYAGCRLRLELLDGLPMPASLNKAYWESEPEACLPSTLVVRRELWDRTGGFDPGLRVSEDSDWLVRAREAQARLAMVSTVLVIKRVHAHNLSHDAKATGEALLASLRQSVARRNAAHETDSR